jgi:hypothetical protein
MAEPPGISSRIPKINRMITIGIIHHFLLFHKKPSSSPMIPRRAKKLFSPLIHLPPMLYFLLLPYYGVPHDKQIYAAVIESIIGISR